MVKTACLICHNENGNEIIELKELQLGLGEKFHYQLCGACGSLHLLDPPADFSRYYPNEDYYSFKMDMKDLAPPGYLRKAKAEYLLHGKNKLMGSLLSIGYKLPEYYTWMSGVHAGFSDAILDVGCGNGSLLTKLYKMGFTNLTGIDPFIDQPDKESEIRILKKDIFSMDEHFDVIMMHHALEHMPDPLLAMKKAHSLLNENKYLLVRIPIMGNYGWNRYREFWAGLDAPRHMFIPSEKAMRILAEQAGFQVEKVEYDTVDYLIWCSEQYKHGISLYDKRSRMINKKNSMFSESQIKKFRQILADANAKNYGDTAAFYLQKLPLSPV